MMRYTLRYRGRRPPPEDDLDRLAGYPGVHVIDRAVPGLALVEAPDGKLSGLRRLLPDWAVEQEHESVLSDTWPDRRTSRTH